MHNYSAVSDPSSCLIYFATFFELTNFFMKSYLKFNIYLKNNCCGFPIILNYWPLLSMTLCCHNFFCVELPRFTQPLFGQPIFTFKRVLQRPNQMLFRWCKVRTLILSSSKLSNQSLASFAWASKMFMVWRCGDETYFLSINCGRFLWRAYCKQVNLLTVRHWIFRGFDHDFAHLLFLY